MSELNNLPVEVEATSPNSYQPVDNRPLTKSEAGLLALMGVVAAGFIGFIGFMSVKDQKAYEARQAELAEEQAEREREAQAKRDEFDAWVSEQTSSGKVVVHFRVGDRIAIPVEAYKDVEVRRLPGMRD